MSRARPIAAALLATLAAACSGASHPTTASAAPIVTTDPDTSMCPLCRNMGSPARLTAHANVLDAAGPLDVRTIHSVVQSSLQSLDNRGLRCWVDVNGARVRIVIDASGRVTASAIEQPEQARNTDCVVATSAAWRFPATTGGTATTAHFVVSVQNDIVFEDAPPANQYDMLR